MVIPLTNKKKHVHVLYLHITAEKALQRDSAATCGFIYIESAIIFFNSSLLRSVTSSMSFHTG